MTDSPTRACPPAPDHRRWSTHDNRQTPPTPRTGSTVSAFSELNSIRPLDVRLQDLRPLRGRPSADPGPSRLTGVYPYTRRRKQNQGQQTDPAPLTGPAPSGMTQRGRLRRTRGAPGLSHPSWQSLTQSVFRCRPPTVTQNSRPSPSLGNVVAWPLGTTSSPPLTGGSCSARSPSGYAKKETCPRRRGGRPPERHRPAWSLPRSRRRGRGVISAPRTAPRSAMTGGRRRWVVLGDA